MKVSVIVCLCLFFAPFAFAMQSPDDADHDRCLYQYKGNPVGMHEDDICLRLADRTKFSDLVYLIGRAYQLAGQREKAIEYFQQVEEDPMVNSQEYCRKAAEQLLLLEKSATEQ